MLEMTSRILLGLHIKEPRPIVGHVRIRVALLFAVTCALECRGDSSSAAPPIKVRAAIEARDRSLEAAQLSGDATKLAEHYTPDATLYATGGGKDIHGHDEIAAAFTQLYATTVVQLASLRTTDMRERGSLVEESGRFAYQFRTRDGVVICQRGDYTVVWRRESDSIWRIVSDRSHFDRPYASGPCTSEL